MTSFDGFLCYLKDPPVVQFSSYSSNPNLQLWLETRSDIKIRYIDENEIPYAQGTF